MIWWILLAVMMNSMPSAFAVALMIWLFIRKDGD